MTSTDCNGCSTGFLDPPAVGTGIKDAEAFVQDADRVMHVGRIVVGIVALAGGEAGLKIWGRVGMKSMACVHTDDVRAVGGVVADPSGRGAPGVDRAGQQEQEEGAGQGGRHARAGQGALGRYGPALSGQRAAAQGMR
jgi:hypothetical protein